MPWLKVIMAVLIATSASAQDSSRTSGTMLVIHGGAGKITRGSMTAETEKQYQSSGIDGAQLAFELNSLFFGANFEYQLRKDRKALVHGTHAIEQRPEGVRITKKTPMARVSGRRAPTRRPSPRIRSGRR